jgi:hypothetical protein
MRNRTPRMEYTECRRCGKPIATLSAYGRRRLRSNEQLYAEFGRICSACMTTAEQHDVQDAQVREKAQLFSGKIQNNS